MFPRGGVGGADKELKLLGPPPRTVVDVGPAGRRSAACPACLCEAARMKGILLAGGHGTRLAPLTGVISKQLLPVYNKPMVYYPLSVLMLAGIREVMVISTPAHLPLFEAVLGEGTRWGMSFRYVPQPEPAGLAQAFLLDPGFHAGDASCLVLGDNLIHGSTLRSDLAAAAASVSGPAREAGCTIFGYPVKNPTAYGVVGFDDAGRATSLEEKPAAPASAYAVPGLYFYDDSVTRRAAALAPSPRGELEITDLNRTYLDDGSLRVTRWGRGTAWLDAGTHETLLEAQQYVHAVEERQGLLVGCPEEVAFRNGWIDAGELGALAEPLSGGSYGRYLAALASG